MAAATLTTIGAALFAALRELGRPATPAAVPTTAPFDEVEWYAGQSAEGTSRPGLGRSATSAALAFPGARADGESGEAVSTIIDGAQVVMRALWVVYVTVNEPRDDETLYTGAAGEPGMLTSVERVVQKFTGLRIAGLWDAAPRVQFVDVRIGKIVPRQSATYVVTFATHHTVQSIEPLPDAVPLERIDGETGPEGETDLLTFTADTTAT